MQQNEDKKTSKTSEKSVFVNPKVVIFFISSAILAIIFYGYYLVNEELKKLQITQSVMQEKINSNMGDNQQLVKKADINQKNIQQHYANIRHNKSQIEALLSDKRLNSAKMLLKSISFSLQMAQWLLEFQHDAKGAQYVLQSSLDKLSDATFSFSLQLRTVLSTDIKTLDAMPKLNVVDLLINIQAISNQVATLPAWQHKFSNKVDQVVQDDGDILSRLKRNLQKVIVIRKAKSDMILSPDGKVVMEQNIQLMLQQAQWALLHRNNAVYSLNLRKATSWLSKFYSKDKSKIQYIQNDIDKLISIDIGFVIPTLQSQAVVEKLLNNQYARGDIND